jgi:hypothetical protein
MINSIYKKLEREKHMFKVKIADIVIEIDNIYSFIEEICKDYIYDGDGFDFHVASSQKEIDEERERMHDGEEYSDGYLENICVYRQIALLILEKDAFVMHAAVVGVDDKAYAFTARSGTGKSTHIALWKLILGDRVYVINGDKPIIRLLDNKLYAFGTPWCGKDGINQNKKVPLAGICFLKRGEENKIRRLDKKEAVQNVLWQTTRKLKDINKITTLLSLVDRLVREIPIFELECTKDTEAAVISSTTMCRAAQEENL